MSSKSTVTKQPARFSRNNLPPSEEEALARIHELNVETSSVAAKLQNANPRNFTSEDAYKEWRSRACIRLNCSHEEISFLERWLRGRQQIAERFELGHTGGDGRGELDPVSERALQLAQEIGRDYAVTYTNSAQPKDLHAAHERLGYLTLVRRQIEAAFS